MDKIIPFNKGIHRQPSVGAEGELSELVNLIPQNGELVNVRGMEEFKDITYNNKKLTLLGVHRFMDDEIYLLTDAGRNTLYYQSSTYKSSISSKRGKINNVVTHGSFAIVSCEEGRFFLVWENGAYTNIGDQIPHLPLRIRIWASETTSGDFYTEYSNLDSNLRAEYQANYNILAAEHLVEPAIIRYVYRLFDGSLYDPSTLIYLPIGESYPTFFIHTARSSDPNLNICRMNGLISGLDCVLQGDRESFDKYAALISEVVFYISPIRLIGDELVKEAPYNAINYVFSVEGAKQVPNASIWQNETIVWLRRSENDIIKSITEASNFYRFKAVKFKSLISKDAVAILPPDTLLTNITSADRLDIDSPANRTWSGSNFVYNQRLVMANIKKDAYNPPYASCFFPRYQVGGAGDVEQTNYVELENDGKTVIYKTNADLDPNKFHRQDRYDHIQYIYFPDSNAKALYVAFKFSSGTEYLKIPLTRHTYLNGAYWCRREGILWETWTSVKESDPITSHPERVIVSEAYNPIVNRSISEIQVGNGEIVGLSSSAAAISQGQFGQYPLLAFCTDGIWALEVGEDGGFYRVSPVARDICNNPDSITSIDGAVVFTTDQGLMMIQGSEVVNLSGAMEGFNVDESVYFKPTADGTPFFESFGQGEYDNLVITEKRDFREILKTCKIAYDYANRLLRIFPKENTGKYYVYSLESSEFATVYLGVDSEGNALEVRAVVADYPSSIIQMNDKLYRPAERDDNTSTKKGLLLTRPMMLDEPFALKKLQDMRLHYSKFDGTSKCRVVVYVSNDGANWTAIKSLRGRSYKYFRFAVITGMKDMDALSGMVLRYEVERNNKLR